MKRKPTVADEMENDAGAEANAVFLGDLKAVDPNLSDLDADLVMEVAMARAATDAKLRQTFADRDSNKGAYREQLRQVANAIRERAGKSPNGGRAPARLSEEDAKVMQMSDGQFANHLSKSNPAAWRILGL
jgi:hypothetical protein